MNEDVLRGIQRDIAAKLQSQELRMWQWLEITEKLIKDKERQRAVRIISENKENYGQSMSEILDEGKE